MNLSRAKVSFQLEGTATPPTALVGTAGKLDIGGTGTVSTDYPLADVLYSGYLSGITDTVNPTLVLASGTVTLNGATLTGMTASNKDCYSQTIPSISTGYAVMFKRTDSNGGVLSVNGGTSGFAGRLSAGKTVLIDEPSIVTADTITFDNSTTAAATVYFVVLGKDT